MNLKIDFNKKVYFLSDFHLGAPNYKIMLRAQHKFKI